MRLRQRTVRPLVLAKRLRRVKLEPCWLEQTESLNSGAAVELTQRRGKVVRPLGQTARPLLRLHWKAWPQQTDSSEKPMTAELMVLSTARQQQKVRLGQATGNAGAEVRVPAIKADSFATGSATVHGVLWGDRTLKKGRTELRIISNAGTDGCPRLRRAFSKRAGCNVKGCSGDTDPAHEFGGQQVNHIADG